MVKYFAVAAAALLDADHAARVVPRLALLLVLDEAGGRAQATDAYGAPVRFPGREFDVDGGIVCCSRSASLKMLNLLRAGVADDYQTEALLQKGDRPF